MSSRVTLFLAACIPFGCGSRSPVEPVPASNTVSAPTLSAPVDVVRDLQGIPHIYGRTLADVAYVQGYVMAEDRLIQLDLARRSASGTLSEIAGDLSPSLIDSDISMRVHHLRSTSQKIFDQLKADPDPDSQRLVAALTAYAAGVNAAVADLQAGNWQLAPVFSLAYDPNTWVPWSEVDSIVIGHLITFQLSYDDVEIYRTALAKAAAAIFPSGPRMAIGDDLLDLRPIDPTYTLPGDFSTLQPITQAAVDTPPSVLLAAWKDASALGHRRALHPEDGSNNFIVGPQLSATGHTLVANDPHLSLQNPPTFYLCHLVVSDAKQPVDVMGAQFPGAPGVILGMNRHVAWAATTSNLDDSDVYSETIVPCGGGACVMFHGQPVPLVSRVEPITVGKFGHPSRTVMAQLWDVPHHGPILPRILADHSGTEPLGSTELSVRWTGHEPTMEVRALLGLDGAASVKDAETALEKYFKTGGENWLLGDDQGHFGWTEATRVPRRPAGTRPWMVLPGDGSAEWGSDLDLRWVPHAFDPAKGYLATANADPIGVTDDGEPFASEPVVDGAPLYIGFNFDPGTRVGRITKRLDALIAKKGKLTLDDLQSVQADDVSEWDQMMQSTFLDAAQAILDEIAQPGTHQEIAALVAQADTPSKQTIGMVRDAVMGWQFDTPADSLPALVFNVWVTRLADLALTDELDQLGMGVDADAERKLLARMCSNPSSLHTPLSSTGDNILWDDVTTPAIESKRQIAAKAIFDALDYLFKAAGKDPHQWQWGQLHTLTLAGLLPLDALRIPLKTDPMFGNGFPRHGDNGTVDVGDHGMAVDSFGYDHGPVIRAVYELDPAGPKARNALPGGEAWNPLSPHYRDLMEYWRQNQTFNMAFDDFDVVQSALYEIQANGGGRVRFQP